MAEQNKAKKINNKIKQNKQKQQQTLILNKQEKSPF